MNKQELAAMVAEILGDMDGVPVRCPERGERPEGMVPDVTKVDLRKLYMTEHPADRESFLNLKAHTPARLGSGRAGARYKTLTMLRFRADHAAAQDSVFSQVSDTFAKSGGMTEVQTRCHDKDEYLTRPDYGRSFDEENARKIREALPKGAQVQIVIGDGLSSAAIEANAMVCTEAIRQGLKRRNIDPGMPIFVRYCRVGAGDAIGDITGCQLVCVLVGERPGLVTNKSMSAYLTYRPHKGVSESSRTVVSNIHDQGTPAAKAGDYIAELMQTILKRQVSGVGLHLEQIP